MIFGEIPMSFEEKSKYGYGFVLSKYKIDPHNQYIQTLENKAEEKDVKSIVKYTNEFEPMIPKLLNMKEDFTLEKATNDYRTGKDELYLEEKD